MGKNHVSSPFLFTSTFPSDDPSESSPPSSPSPSPSLSPPRSPSFCSTRSYSSFNSPYKSLSTLSRPPLCHSSSTYFPPPEFGPCAACKFHGRRCSENCYLASFFPPNDVHKFAVVDSVFGSGNVDHFLQQNSNSSYIPLLLLLRDTTQEDGELHSDSLSDTDNRKQLGASVDSDPIRELIQARELANQLKEHLSSESLDIITEQLIQRILSSFEKSLSILNLSGSTRQLQKDVALAVTASNGPTKSPIYMDGSPASVNFGAILNAAAKKRKTVPRLTDHAVVRTKCGMEGIPDDGYSWRKYGQKDILDSKYPRSYYRCIHRHTLNCWATKQIQRCNEEPDVFEITYRGNHNCSDGPPQASPEEQKEKQTNFGSSHISCYYRKTFLTSNLLPLLHSWSQISHFSLCNWNSA